MIGWIIVLCLIAALVRVLWHTSDWLVAIIVGVVFFLIFYRIGQNL